jgi:cytochrome c553
MSPLLRLGAAAAVVLSIVTGQQRARQVLAAPGSDAPQAPSRLSETGLYLPGQPGQVDPRNRAFSPQYPLWSDGAHKSRWVFLPDGAVIDARASDWDVPVGTRFWKEFRFADRKVETRMLWKTDVANWVVASYLWNAGQTDAVLAPAEGVPNVAEIAQGRAHSIPSRTDCLACHGAKRTSALGFNVLQLSTDRDSGAIHGEPLEPGMVTLETLVREERLAPLDGTLVSQPPRIAATDPQTRALLGYLSANCGTCHNGSGEIAVLGPSLKFSDLLADGDGVAARLTGHRTAWQVPGVAEGQSMLVDPRTPDQSAMLVRMRSRRPSSQMPPLGTVVKDQEAVSALQQWIAARPLTSH